MIRSLFFLILMLALGACGRVAPLTPGPGQTLPVKPRTAAVTPSAEELLMLPTNAAPERIDELLRRSEPRRTDRFDLPPPDGGQAPKPDTEERQSSEEAGPATPQW